MIPFLTLVLFWGQYLVKNPSPLLLLLFLFLSIVLYLFLFRPRPKISKIPLLPTLFVFSFLIVIAFVLSPLIIPQKLNGETFRRFPGVIDYYKHSYTLTAINFAGLPPRHPFRPDTVFSYYYGYYLIPAAIVKIFSLPQTTVIYGYVLFTDFLCLLLLYHLTGYFLKNKLLRFLALPVLVFATGFDILPFLSRHQLADNFHIEEWFGLLNTGHMVYNPYTAFLWAPQHLFPAILSLVILCRFLFRRPINFFWFVFTVAYIGLSSIFVAISLIFWLGLISIFRPESRRHLFAAFPLCLLLTFPFLLSIFGRGHLLSPYFLQPYPFFPKAFPLNYFLTLLVEYGPLTFILPFLLKKSVYLLFLYPWFFLTLFIRSPVPNDFCMKSTLPLIIFLHLLFFQQIEISRPRLRSILLILVFAFSLVGVAGALVEYRNRYRSRLLLSYDANQLLDQLSSLPPSTRLTVLTRDESFFKIPVFTPHPVFSPSLYDAGVYASSFSTGFDYEKVGQKLFVLPSSPASSPAALLASQNLLLSLFPKYIEETPATAFLLSRRQWVKQGLDFWYALFSQHQIAPQPLTDNFSLFDYQPIKAFSQKYRLSFNPDQLQKFTLKNQQLALPPGHWLLYACLSAGNSPLKVELEDYFTLFSGTLGPDDRCLGNLFYHQSSSPLTVSSSTTVTQLFAVPLTVSGN